MVPLYGRIHCGRVWPNEIPTHTGADGLYAATVEMMAYA